MADKKLVLWYKLDEILKGGIIEDSSGNAYHGEIKGDGAIVEDKTKALSLGEQGEGYITIPKNALKTCKHLTIMAWIKPKTLQAWERLFDFGSIKEKNIFFAVNSNVANSNGGRPVLSLHSGSIEEVHSKLNLISNKWHYVAVTVEENTATIYIDGMQAGVNENISISPSIFTDGENYIGKSHYEQDPYYNGYIQDFRIYEEAFSAEMIRTIMVEKMTTKEVVEVVFEALDIPNRAIVKENIAIPEAFLPGVNMTWESSNEAVVATDGTVVRPKDATQKVVLTATLNKDEVTKIKSFEMSVLKEGQPSYMIDVDCEKKGVDISDTFIGVFFEDINYGADGGLYAELINNRSFEFGKFKDTLSRFDDYFYAWSVIEKGNGIISHRLATEAPIHENNPHYLEVTIEKVGQGVGICNEGFGGIPVIQNQQYNFSAFLKNQSYEGKVRIMLGGENGEVYAETSLEINKLSGTWQKVEASLVSAQTDPNAKLVMMFDGIGTLDVDMVSLFPENTWANRKNGLRCDLVQSLKDLKPKFVRFPGGCIVEGKYLTNAYNWKDTVGPVEQRKTNWNRWEEGRDYPYNQSYGLGFYEYFQLSEDIGAAPLPILNCGMSCQFQGSEVAEDIEPYIQDALDLIEYANGDETTTWGRRRIADGHEKPFNLVYLGIGNEQWVDYDKHVKDKYFTIYESFRNRIKEKYPEIQLSTTTGPFPDGKEFDIAWDIITEKTNEYIEKDAIYAELVDEHYYMSPEWFLENGDRYDHYPRYKDGKSAKVFAGEYACHTNGGPSKQGVNNLYAAICEAAFMIGLEKNSDVVAMTAYAPLFAKTTNVQWQPDLIWFNNTDVYGSPSYFVQKMFGNNMGTYTMQTEIISNSQIESDERLPIYAISSKDEVTGDLIIKLVNASAASHDIRLNLNHTDMKKADVKGTLLTSSNPNDMNTIEEPTKVRETYFDLGNVEECFDYTVPEYAFVVLRLSSNK